MLLTEDLVYLQIAGILGWARTPAAFQVVTRAIIWELRHALQSDVLMYVDDIMGVGMAEHVPTDIALTMAICTSLLGPTSVADDKTEQGRYVIMGYVIDLDTQRVSISRKNLLSALHGFITVDINGSMTLRVAQRLASQASRYGKICRVMRPFCGALNRLIAGRTSVQNSLHADPGLLLTIPAISHGGVHLIPCQTVNGAEVATGVCAVSFFPEPMRIPRSNHSRRRTCHPGEQRTDLSPTGRQHHCSHMGPH
jgi:hypothetical protein